jgi:hypothetical protein
MGILTLPPASDNLILTNVFVPSGYVNYFLLAHQQMANSGESLDDFLVRQVIYQSVERYAKYVIEQNYNSVIASGDALQSYHGNFVADIAGEESTLLGQYSQ